MNRLLYLPRLMVAIPGLLLQLRHRPGSTMAGGGDVDVAYLLVVIATIAALTGVNAWLLPRRRCAVTAEHAPPANYEFADPFDGDRGWIGQTVDGRVVIVRAVFGQLTTLVFDSLDG